MDTVNYERCIYKKIKEDFRKLALTLKIDDLRFVPVSALQGDNVVSSSNNMDWYPGSTLLKLLETISVNNESTNDDMRFPIQYVNRPDSSFRGYCGTLASGKLMVEDEITIYPSQVSSKIKSIYSASKPVNEVFAGNAITVTLHDDIDVSRGDMLVHKCDAHKFGSDFIAKLVWMDNQSLTPHKDYLIKFSSKSCLGKIVSIEHKIDINTFQPHQLNADSLHLNEIALCKFTLTDKVVIDEFSKLPQTGTFIVIDKISNQTAAAGMIANVFSNHEPKQYTASEKVLNAFVREHYPEWGCHKV